MAKRRKNQGTLSGYCFVAHGQYPCPGSFQNGNNPGGVSLCSCDCHGDLTERLRAVGQYQDPEDDVEDADDPVESVEEPVVEDVNIVEPLV